MTLDKAQAIKSSIENMKNISVQQTMITTITPNQSQMSTHGPSLYILQTEMETEFCVCLNPF